MEILFVSHKFPPATGGMEKQSAELINGMKLYATVHSIVYTGKESRLSFFLTLNIKILETCRQFPGISVIHFNDALIAAISLNHKGYSHLYRAVTVHGLDIVYPNRLYRKYIIPAFNRYDLIIAVSEATAQACIDRKIRPEKVVTINNGVDHLLLQSGPATDYLPFIKDKYGIDLYGKTVLTSLGRPVKRKGFSWFIKNVVPELHGNFIFILAGPFDKERSVSDILFSLIPGFVRSGIALLLGYATDENEIRKLLAQSKYRNRVAHLGILPHEELIGLLSVTHGFVMPNISVEGDMEGFGLVCLEASICGAWIFAAGIDGITDAIHPKKNGTLLPAENEESWVPVLNNFIKDPSHYKVLLQHSASYTKQNFGWNKMVQAYYQCFSEASDKQ